MPDSRKLIRGAVIGVGLVALVGVSVLAGRLSSQEPAAAAKQQPTAAEQATPGADAAGGHDHGGEDGENPWLVQPEEPVEPWSKQAKYTDEAGNPFTVLAEIVTPTTAGMGMCSMGQMASEYSRTVVLSVRNDSGKAVPGPRIGIADERVGFPHSDAMGCSWANPQGVSDDYAPDEVRTFRGLVKLEPKDQDVVLVTRPEVNTEKFLPADGEFTDAQFDEAAAKASAAAEAATKEILRIPADVVVD